MLKHRSTSSLIPLLVPIVFGSACFAQDDPFAVPSRRTAPVEKKSQPSSPIEENEQIKLFRAQLAAIEATYADMANKNRAYVEMIERLTKQNNLNRLRGKSDDEVKDVFNQMEKQNEELRRKLDMVVQQNDALKQRVAAQEESETELRSLAKSATENRLAVVDDEIRIMKETNPALMVDATYNVAGLESLGKIKTDDLLQMLKESFSEQGVKFAKLDSSISAKTTERTQRKIQEKIASLAPPL